MTTPKIIIASALVAAGLFMAQGCDETVGRKGNGHVTTETRTVDPFTELELETVFPVEIVQDGNREWVKVVADDNLQELITVKNSGNRLIVKMKDKARIRSSEKMKVIVNIRQINRLSNHSVGALTTRDKLVLDSLEINTESVGKMDLYLKADFLRANLKSVGSNTLRGEVREVRINNKSVGTLHAYELKAATLMIHNTAVGAAEVYADSSFRIRSSAIGTLHYKGPGKVEELSSEGIGKVSHTD